MGMLGASLRKQRVIIVRADPKTCSHSRSVVGTKWTFTSRTPVIFPVRALMPAVPEQFWEFDCKMIHERYLSLEEEMGG